MSATKKPGWMTSRKPAVTNNSGGTSISSSPVASDTAIANGSGVAQSNPNISNTDSSSASSSASSTDSPVRRSSGLLSLFGDLERINNNDNGNNDDNTLKRNSITPFSNSNSKCNPSNDGDIQEAWELKLSNQQADEAKDSEPPPPPPPPLPAQRAIMGIVRRSSGANNNGATSAKSDNASNISNIANSATANAPTNIPFTSSVKMCEACSDDAHEATHICVECNENMCAMVAECHCKTKFTKDHHVNPLFANSSKPFASPIKGNNRASLVHQARASIMMSPPSGGGRRASIVKYGSEKNKESYGQGAKKCPVHLVKIIDLCCLQCEDTPLICQFCVIESHKDHKICSIGEISDKRRRDIARVYEQLEDPVKTSKEVLEELTRRMNQLDRDKINGIAKISADFETIIAQLNARKLAFTNDFENSYRQSYQVLLTEHSNTNSTLENALGFQNLAEQLLETGSDLEICETSKNLCNSIKDLVKIFDDSKNISSCVLSQTEYVAAVGAAIGSIENPYKVLNHSNNKKSNLNQSIAMIGNNLNSSRTKSPPTKSSVQIGKVTSSVSQLSAEERRIERTKSPSQTISSATNSPKKSSTTSPGGLSKISNGRSSSGGGTSGLVKIKDVEAGDSGSAVGKLSHPNGLCLQLPYSDGYSGVYTDCLMYVADESLNKIQVFNVTTGLRIKTLGSNLGFSFCPHGMTVFMPDGRTSKDPILFVADYKNNKVFALDTVSGALLNTFGTGIAGCDRDQFNQPSGIGILLPSVSSTTSHLSEPLLYIADSMNHRVQVYNAITGEFFCSIGSKRGSNGQCVPGSGPGDLNFPVGLCLKQASQNRNGLGFSDPLLFVADKNNHRIQVFNAFTGAFVRTIASGIKGTGPHELNSPRRLDIICVNEKEDLHYLFVADYHNHRITIFNAETGLHVKVLGERPRKTTGCHNIDVTSRQKGDGVGELNCPSDIVAFADSNGEILVYVAERNNHRIQVLSGEVHIGDYIH